MRGQLHLSPSGPAPCSAEAGECPYEAGGHYETPEAAESDLADSMGGVIPAAERRTIELSSNLGTVEVADGDLGDPRARAALSSGLCGDLALAIHRQTGGTPYFLSYHFNSSEELAEAFAEESNSVIAGSCHVLIESPSAPGEFLDSYGRQDAESLEEAYDDAAIIPGTPEMLEHFADQHRAARLSSFARSAIALDRDGVRYSQDLDELGWDDGDEDWDEEPETVELQLSFGAQSVPNGDLSDPKTRFYFSNGLCGDLAMAVHERLGGTPYFAVDSTISERDLEVAAERGELGSMVSHAFVESRLHPGKFLDGYGLKTREEIESFYGTEIRPVAVEQLRAYGSGPGGRRGSHDLSAFADEVSRLERQGRSYSYTDFGD